MSQSIFKNPYVQISPALTPSSIGNGTLTIDRLTHFTVNQNYTAVCSAISPFTVFNIIGNLDGNIGVAVVGTQFFDEDLKVFLTIQQGPTLFQIGDTFEFTVHQGVDLNQQNIDLYDELPQKNFGQGVVGETAGDHNIRLSSNPQKAFRILDHLRYTSKTFGPSGNAISVQYIQGSSLTAAQKTIQSLTFTANAPGVGGNDISMEYIEGSPGTIAQAIIQDLGYDAITVGAFGNAISIEYVGGGTAGSEVVTVIGNAIKVQIQSGVSTADDIEVAIAISSASLLVETNQINTGSEPQFVQAPVFLTGGTDPSGQVVTVVGNAISVIVQSGVTTASEIKSALDSSPAAITLITTTISGVGVTTQTSPVSPTFLVGGADDVGQPGSELVTVVGKEIKVTFVDGMSTAAQIKTAVEANGPAAALVDIAFTGAGTEFESSPVARTFLSGGRLGGSYAFNTSELTNPGDFFEGNAPVIFNGETNQGDELTLGETMKKGKVTLDDDETSNNSGLAVDNVQKTINGLIQNDKVFLVTADNTKVDWQKPNLNFLADILFIFPDTGFINKILLANAPIVIADGYHAYVTINRLANVNLSVTVATTIPKTENTYRLFSRRGDDLVWYDNTLQRDKKKIRIGEGGGGGTAYQEKLGTGNGAAVNFGLTFIPSNEFSILVISSYIRTEGVDYTYNSVGNQITFTTAPAAGQDVYVFYLTDGETLSVPTPNGLLNSYVHTVTNAEELATTITLNNIPAEPSKVLVDIVGGTSQEYNVDYNISADQFQWGGFGLDGFLAENDKVRFYFYS